MHKQGLLVYAALAMSALGAFGCSAKDHDKAAVDDGSAPPGPFSTTKYNLQFEGRYFCEETGAAWPEPGACWGTFDADIYHPTDASGAPYPAVVAASGHLGNKDAINWVAEYLATYGYIVMVFSQPHPDQWNATQLAAGHRTGIDVLTEENMRSG